MPQIKLDPDLEREAPTEPHLALLTDESGLATAIEPGATMFLIEQVDRADKIFPVVLAKVGFRKGVPDYLLFICACGEIGCNRNYRFKCVAGGWHRRKQKPIAQQERGSLALSVTNAPSPNKE